MSDPSAQPCLQFVMGPATISAAAESSHALAGSSGNSLSKPDMLQLVHFVMMFICQLP
jgi:hypothetical protein